eukprot:TRINITY_DN211_c0_g4_i15.p1 TRINITY_DN211_c0_g4~~TRINITY_DN211_c0_g4_i15.p1  ORF type:complete len:182 (+),score=13.57 TRINITY_DN211_c0_g4_i15:93-638(+)
MQLNMHSHKRVSLSDAEMSSRLFQLADYITHNYATLKSNATLYSNSYNPGSMTHFQPYAQAPVSLIPESWHGDYLSPSTITYHTTSLVRPTPLKASHSSSASANLWKSTNHSNSVDAVPIVRNITVDKIKRKADQGTLGAMYSASIFFHDFQIWNPFRSHINSQSMSHTFSFLSQKLEFLS